MMKELSEDEMAAVSAGVKSPTVLYSVMIDLGEPPPPPR